MNLCAKLARICIDAVDANPAIRELADNFFKSNTSKFGYHISQLKERHKLPGVLAARMSPILNLWVNFLESGKVWTISPKDTARMLACTKALSTLGRPSSCKLKICPWCRAIKTMKVEAILAAQGAQGCIVMDYPLVDTLPVLKTNPEALLVVKNVLFIENKPVLRVIYAFKTLEPGMDKQLSRIRELLRYDYVMLSDPGKFNTWMKLTENMNMFSKKYGPRAAASNI